MNIRRPLTWYPAHNLWLPNALVHDYSTIPQRWALNHGIPGQGNGVPETREQFFVAKSSFEEYHREPQLMRVCSKPLGLGLLAVLGTLVSGVLLAADEVKPEVIKDRQGVALSVIGNYDVGLDEASSRIPAQVAEAVSKFIL